MNRIYLLITCLCYATLGQASVGLSIRMPDSFTSVEKETFSRVILGIENKLPEKFIQGLPRDIKLRIRSYKNQEQMPDVCNQDNEGIKFTYGEYRKIDKSLTLNQAIVNELLRGEENSKKINCQHGSLYQQAVSTIIHELAHAYDFHNGSPSKKADYRSISGFGKFLFFNKKRNVNPVRIADDYEFKNISESFAVNFEYHTMGRDFKCRRPSVSQYFQDLFGEDLYKDKSCESKKPILLATASGLLPYEIDFKRVYRIDYLMAAKGSDASSGFGHAMLRIVMCAPEQIEPISGKMRPATKMGPDCLKDKLYHLVASFRANNQGTTLNYMKGIFGGYPSMLFFLPFGDVINQYNHTEMRDLTSYPINFNPAEKNDILNHLIETHWTYKGDYKFITNNCATETLQLLKVVTEDHERVESRGLLPKITPHAVITVLKKYRLLDPENPETEVFKSSAGNLLRAFEMALKNESDEKNLKHYIENSTHKTRYAHYQSILIPSQASTKAELESLKLIVGRLASFSVIEQQIIKIQAGILQKKLGEFVSEEKNRKTHPEIFEILHSTQAESSDVSTLDISGYGVPSTDEVTALFESLSKSTSSENFNSAKTILETLFPEDVKSIESNSEFLQEINKKAFTVRKFYRQSLEAYIVQGIQDLSISEEGQQLLLKALQSPSLIRNVLGDSIVTETEITDKKLQNLIGDVLN